MPLGGTEPGNKTCSENANRGQSAVAAVPPHTALSGPDEADLRRPLFVHSGSHGGVSLVPAFLAEH
jgi:hypothetical protein